MTQTSLIHSGDDSARSVGGVLFSAWAALLLGVIITCACNWAAANSLGLFFGPILLSCCLAPSMMEAEPSITGRVVVGMALTLGIGVVWALQGQLAPAQTGKLILILWSTVLAIGGLVSAIDAAGGQRPFSAAITAGLMLAWLTWPIWLCTWLSGSVGEQTAAVLTSPHPLLAANGVLLDRFGAWDRYRVAYQQLTTLNQDVYYTLPQSVVLAVGVHLGIGAAGFGLLRITASASRRRAQTH